MKKANKNFLYGDSIIISYAYAVEEEEFKNGNERKKNEKIEQKIKCKND